MFEIMKSVLQNKKGQGMVEYALIIALIAVVLVGDDPASSVYVKSKEKAAKAAGIAGSTHILPASASRCVRPARRTRSRMRSERP